MSNETPKPFSDYIIFVDETGDHGMTSINRDFPLFGLENCGFRLFPEKDEGPPGSPSSPSPNG